eukprot:CAMPEP_0182604172 /NCGR_PEP_ID=MMETSP1324-20130603/92860_1 /TAXON_ID=236786 /ORGANISM="Florenciella sp., Strain RCC1587" /LENGTH=119 /DNA_ID=CAMNT_0024822103 /DNA_START=97 /DNA_END=456 /DNA_ORIENTATION=-
MPSKAVLDEVALSPQVAAHIVPEAVAVEVSTVLVVVVVGVAVVEALVVTVPVRVCVVDCIAPVVRAPALPKLLLFFGAVGPDPVPLGGRVSCADPAYEREPSARALRRDQSLNKGLLLG